MNKTEYQTTLAKVQAKWLPDIRLGEGYAVQRLMNEKTAALDFSPEGLQAMIHEVGGGSRAREAPHAGRHSRA